MRFLFLVFFIIISGFAMGKEVQIKSTDGFVLKGFLYYPDGKQERYPTVILVHQFGSSSKMWEGFYEDLLKMGYAVLLPDIRGHGKSIIQNGKENRIVFKAKFGSLIDLAGFYRKSAEKVNFRKIPEDISLWVDFLLEKEKIDPENIILIGASLGGITIIPVVLQHDIKGIVSISPGSPESIDKDKIELAISYFENPILFISSLEDPLGSEKRSYNMVKKAINGTLILISGKDHGSALLPDVKGYILEFLKKIK
ncbi:alpha/beta hydrolase family protein [Persephonella sp.]